MNIIFKQIINRLEKAHLLRRIFCQRTMSSSPMHFKQIPIMDYIYENDGCTQADIAEKLQVSPACIATSTKRLQKAGFITKNIDEENLRCKRLSLTADGKKLLEESRAPFEEYDRFVFRNITPEEIETVNKILDKMLYNMEEALGEKHSGSDFYEISKLIRKVKMEKEEDFSHD